MNKAYALTDSAAPPGLGFWPKATGELASVSGIKYELGGYTCPHIIEKGCGWVNARGEIRKMRPGDMFCIMNDGEIEYYDDPKDPWTFHWIHIDGDSADALARSWGFSPETPWIRPEEPKRVLDGFKKVLAMARSPYPPRPNALAALLFNLSDSIQNPEPFRRSKSERLVERAKAIVETQLHTALNVAELADSLSVDRTTLFHAFRRECGLPPIDYLRERRIERACSILRNDDRTLADVARICGFSSDKYLIKTFKRLKGATPREFARKTWNSGKE